MSLIQEALRRQQQEQENASNAASGQPAILPSEIPLQSAGKRQNNQPPVRQESAVSAADAIDTKDASSGKRKPRVGIVVFISILLLCVAVGAVVFLTSMLISTMKGEPKPAETAKTQPVKTQPAPVAAEAPRPPGKKNSVLEAPAASGEKLPASRPEQKAAADVPESAAAVSAPANEAPRAQPSATQPKTPAPGKPVAEAPQVVKKPQPANWPVLKLSAVINNPRTGQSAAMLNHKLIDVGAEIDGVILIEVLPDAVRLRCGDEIRLLRVGQSL